MSYLLQQDGTSLLIGSFRKTEVFIERAFSKQFFKLYTLGLAMISATY